MALSAALQVTAIAYPVIFVVMVVFYVMAKLMLRFGSNEK